MRFDVSKSNGRNIFAYKKYHICHILTKPIIASKLVCIAKYSLVIYDGGKNVRKTIFREAGS